MTVMEEGNLESRHCWVELRPFRISFVMFSKDDTLSWCDVA